MAWGHTGHLRPTPISGPITHFPPRAAPPGACLEANVEPPELQEQRQV